MAYTQKIYDCIFVNALFKVAVLMLICLPVISGAQVKEPLKLRIIDKETSKPIYGATLSINGKVDKKVKISYSDARGFLAIEREYLEKDGLVFELAMLGYGTIEITSSNLKSQSDGSIEVKMELTPILLGEVSVDRWRKYSDTTRVSLTDQTFARSVMIDDLFSNVKGFHKDDKGNLFYKGSSVSEITVNGAQFFNKDKQDIYKLLPALVVENIEIVQSNVDSLTNTIINKSRVKINLNFKPEFMKGKFGSANLGAGTSSRFIAQSDLYGYRDMKQISVSFNGNNINSNRLSYSDPTISFSPFNRGTKDGISELTYRNKMFKGKIEISGAILGKLSYGKMQSSTQRRDEWLEQTVKVKSSAVQKGWTIEDSHIGMVYKVDKNHTIQMRHSFDDNKSYLVDSLLYDIYSGESVTKSFVDKNRWVSNKTNETEISFRKFFQSEKRRSFYFEADRTEKQYRLDEKNDVLTYASLGIGDQPVNARRIGNNRLLGFRTEYIEPLDNVSYAKLFVDYLSDRILIEEDGIDSVDENTSYQSILQGSFLRCGIEFSKLYQKTAVTGNVSGQYSVRTEYGLDFKRRQNFNNINLDVRAVHTVSGSRSWTLVGLIETNYPSIYQLTNLGNSFDRISQVIGNSRLKPEVKHRIEGSYDWRGLDSTKYSITGGLDFYSAKHGLNIQSASNGRQISHMDNLGNAFSSNILTTISNVFPNRRSLNYIIGLSYLENPTVSNQNLFLNRSYLLSQSVSSGFSLIKEVWSMNPNFSLSYSRNHYDTNKSSVWDLSYSDILGLDFRSFICNIFPLVNYNYGVGHQFYYGVNVELKKKVLDDFGIVYFQIYDLFDSFKYNYSYGGSSFTESRTFLNQGRYFFLGFTYKFNTMK